MGFSSMNLESVWSMLPDEYCVSLPCELKMTSAISHSHRIDSSMAFLTNPFFRFAKVACLDLSSLIRAILIFLRPISTPSAPETVSHRSSFLLASLSASFALFADEVILGYVTTQGGRNQLFQTQWPIFLRNFNRFFGWGGRWGGGDILFARHTLPVQPFDSRISQELL